MDLDDASLNMLLDNLDLDDNVAYGAAQVLPPPLVPISDGFQYD
jgi:hypothetical protein